MIEYFRMRVSHPDVRARDPARVMGCLALTVDCVASVHVPGADFTQSLRLTSAQGLRASVLVNEPLVLHAERTTGAWVQTESRSLPKDACWIGNPPGKEAEVADNVFWHVQPESIAEFNAQYRQDRTRLVRFPKPGRYRVTGTSTGYCAPDFGGDTIEVEVRSPADSLAK